jgi:hypothetical protein
MLISYTPVQTIPSSFPEIAQRSDAPPGTPAAAAALIPEAANLFEDGGGTEAPPNCSETGVATIPNASNPFANKGRTASSLGPPVINVLSATPQKTRARSAFVPLSGSIPRPRTASVSLSDGGNSEISALSNPTDEINSLLDMFPWLKAVRSSLPLAKSKLRQVAFNAEKNFQNVAETYFDRCFGYEDSDGSKKHVNFLDVDIPISLILDVSGHRCTIAKTYAIPLIQCAVVGRYLSRRAEAEPDERWCLLREVLKWAGADNEPAGMFQLLAIGGKDLLTAVYGDSQTRFMSEPGEIRASYKPGDYAERIGIFSRMVDIEKELNSDNIHNSLAFTLAIGPAICQFTRELLLARSIPDVYKEPNPHAILEEVLTDAFVDIPELEDNVPAYISRFMFCDLTNFCLSKELIYFH